MYTAIHAHQLAVYCHMSCTFMPKMLCGVVALRREEFLLESNVSRDDYKH